MLSSKKHSDHHVGNLLVGNRVAVLVLAVHQVPNHILATLGALFSALLDRFHVQVAHVDVCQVSLAVVREWEPWQQEVDWLETVIEVMVYIGVFPGQLGANFLALEGTTGCEDVELGHGLGDVKCAAPTLEPRARLDVVGYLILDNGNSAFESLLCKGELDKLLLLHELGVGAAVDDVGAEHGDGKRAVDLFGVEVLVFSIEDEVVSVDTKVAHHLLTEQGETEYVAVL